MPVDEIVHGAVLGKRAVRTVDGSHSWLLVNPGRFAEELTNILDAQ